MSFAPSWPSGDRRKRDREAEARQPDVEALIACK
jgi:hypothetical protein